MLKTYLLIAYRNFIRNKIFSAINVLGLSIGISASLVIFLIVHYDFTFDKFEKDRTRLYRVVTDMQFYSSPIFNSGIPAPLPAALKKEVAGVDEIIPFFGYNGDPNVSVTKNNNVKPFVIKHQTDIILTDQSYFKLLPYQWLAGSRQTALEEPFNVVLTAERAKLYFPSIPYEAMIGKQVHYDDTIVATVSGVVNGLPENSDFIFKEFISLSTIPASGLKNNFGWTSWSSLNGNDQLVIRLSPTASPKNVATAIQALELKYDKGNYNAHATRTFRLQPFDDIHFNAAYGSFGDHTASKPTLYGLLAVATFLLVLACINFINLTTAQSTQRAKEIGVRKTLGSSKQQLVSQFLTETFFLSFISLIISILITPLLLKIFTDFIPADLHFNILKQPSLIVFGIILTLAVALLAGFYPALVLSKFKPVSVLKNQGYAGTATNRRALLRKGLTVSQFLIAQIFTMATLLAVKQINFVLTKDMGFKKEAIITVPTPFIFTPSGKPDNRRLVLLDEIKQLPGVQMASIGSNPPASAGWSSRSMKYVDGKKEIETDVRQKYGDTNYLKLYHIPLLAGRNVQQSDTTSEYIINEAYLHVLGFQKPDQIVNRQINGLPVVGVMADFNQESLRAQVKPMAFSSEMGNSFELHIALSRQDPQANSWKTTIALIEQAFKKMYPEDDFSYQFLDESIAKFYKSEQNLSRLLKWATGLAIFISCMGLLGLVIYTTNQRTKEIGIRKVLGASIAQIVSILSKDFVRLVLIASFIAIPLSWWAMNKWLDNFAYKTPVSWWVFFASVLFMVGMALITLSVQTIRAASANPADSLRTE